MSRLRLLPWLPLLVLAALIPPAVSAAAVRAPAPFTMSHTGVVEGAVFRGRFVASQPLCPSGTVEVGAGVRFSKTLVCDDGSGTINGSGASISALASTVRFSGGTGRWAELRGKGICRHPATTNTLTECEGIADFDPVAPSARISRLSVSRPARGKRTITLAFSATDNVSENAVTYEVVFYGGGELATRRGTVQNQNGSVLLKLSVKAPGSARSLRAELEVLDPLDNRRTVTRTAKLPR